MFVAIYWWRLKPGKEDQFREGWRRGTKAIMAKHGGLGSRLHRAADGRMIAYAQWPDEQSWSRFYYNGTPSDPEGFAMMSDAILESGGAPMFKLDVLDDLLVKDAH